MPVSVFLLDDHEIVRRGITQLLETQDDPEQLIQVAFPRLVFGAQHRYGTPVIGTAASLQGLTIADLPTTATPPSKDPIHRRRSSEPGGRRV